MSNQIRRFLARTGLAGAAALASAVLCLPVSAEPIAARGEDTTDTLKKLRAAGSDLRQNAELVEAVLATVRVAPPDAKDSALDVRCAATNVMQEINLLQGIGSPLFMRPAVRALNPP